jgi:hypothetical protein
MIWFSTPDRRSEDVHIPSAYPYPERQQGKILLLSLLELVSFISVASFHISWSEKIEVRTEWTDQSALKQKSIFRQKVHFWARFSPKINPNFFTHLSSVKDHTLVYNLAQEETWDAHEPDRNRSIFLIKMKADYSLLNSSVFLDISWTVHW